MKKLGFGLMRLPLTDPDDKGSVDIELTKKMTDEFIARGFTYFDTAWMYCSFKSECAIKEALVDRYPRDSYTLTSKLHCSFFETLEGRDEIFNEQLKKTGVEYFDYYLLHALNRESYKGKYTALDCFDWLSDKKAKGLVKHIGFSFHDDAECLDMILTEHPEMEFVQLQLNYLDWESERVQSRACYEVARKHKKQIIVMEPVKGGALANVPKNVDDLFKQAEPDLSTASWAIRFAAGLDGVFMVLSGMSNMEQMLDNISYMEDFKVLTESETAIVHQAAKLIRESIAVPCTGCAYCVEGCPAGIPIPDIFALYNADKSRDARANVEAYNALCEKSAPASACIECGQCEGVCPQKLPIIEYLKKSAKFFERK